MNHTLTFLTVLLSLSIFGQGNINHNNGTSIHNGKARNERAFLPRIHLTSAQDNSTLGSPAKGLIVFNMNKAMGEGIYTNIGEPSEPQWQRIEKEQSFISSDYRSSIAYTGATSNSSKVLDSDIFQWRLLSSGDNYKLQARLKNIPEQNVVTSPTMLLRWYGTLSGATSLPAFEWTPSTWNTWNDIYSGGSGELGAFYLGLEKTDKLFRVNVYVVTDSYNSLLIEQF